MSKRTVRLVSILAILGLSTGTAFAEWTIRNDDDASYELIKECGGKKEDWSIAGGVTKKLSIPAGATSCTITVKKTKTSCTVKDGETCVISGTGSIAKK
jgi:hypothetical protein